MLIFTDTQAKQAEGYSLSEMNLLFWFSFCFTSELDPNRWLSNISPSFIARNLFVLLLDVGPERFVKRLFDTISIFIEDQLARPSELQISSSHLNLFSLKYSILFNYFHFNFISNPSNHGAPGGERTTFVSYLFISFLRLLPMMTARL